MFKYIKLKLNKFNFLLLFISSWIIYVLFTGVFLFLKPKEISQEYIDSSSVSNFYSNTIGPDRGILVDNPLNSGLARLKIIDNAKETLDISYFSIEAGKSPDLFFGALIDAADRGVEVNLLLDGFFHGLRGEFKSIIYTFSKHPNMNLKFYEPFNPLKPWTFNNRMHDKYIIADNNMVIIGGRNIGDKYFNPEWYKENITNDRDIIIFNSKLEDPSSVVNEISDYFNLIWNHEYSKPVNKFMAIIRNNKANRKSKELISKFHLAKEIHQDFFNKEIDLMKISFPTNKVSFVHNPIGRFNKEPWTWYEITELMKSADDSIFIQSPYIVPNKHMKKGFLDKKNFSNINIDILTNSMASTPNYPAFAAYMNHRKNIVDSNINLYEFQSLDSLHTKSYIIDREILAIGSFNLDPRSAYLNTESMIVIHGEESILELEEVLSHYMNQSLLVDNDYNYVPKENILELKVRSTKKIILNILSYIVRLFEHLI